MEQRPIIVMGNAVADVVAWPVDEVPRTGSLHPQAISFHSGGCAGNTATVLARLGASVRLVGCVGQDIFGDALLQGWRRSGVDTTLVQQVAGAGTGVTIVLVDSNGERRFISTPAANHHLTSVALPDKALEGVFALHIGGFFAVPGLEDGTLPARLAAARRQGVLTTLDPIGGSARERREFLFPLLPHLDILLLNEDEGEKITGEREPEAMLDFLLARGVGSIILKRGQAGCATVGALGAHEVPAFRVECRDSTGAGDSFVAALLAALARGDRYEEALRWASAAGAATVQAVGATGAWHSWGDLEQIASSRG